MEWKEDGGAGGGKKKEQILKQNSSVKFVEIQSITYLVVM